MLSSGWGGGLESAQGGLQDRGVVVRGTVGGSVGWGMGQMVAETRPRKVWTDGGMDQRRDRAVGGITRQLESMQSLSRKAEFCRHIGLHISGFLSQAYTKFFCFSSGNASQLERNDVRHRRLDVSEPPGPATRARCCRRCTGSARLREPEGAGPEAAADAVGRFARDFRACAEDSEQCAEGEADTEAQRQGERPEMELW